MENVEMKVAGDKLTITIDLAAAGKLSSTGKTMLIATTGGAQPVSHSRGPKVAINVMVPR